MSTTPPELAVAHARFLELVRDLRPDLHRYCARLVGSAIDGEDVVQEALAKAYYALSRSTDTPPLRPWLLRIAHNTAIDFLRRYDRRFVDPLPDAGVELFEETAAPEAVRAALWEFVALPVQQRSCVILKDVLGCSLDEIAATLATTVPAVKAALARGRATLREQHRPGDVPWRARRETSAAELTRLGDYVALFNRRDWQGLERLLAEECRVDLVGKHARHGKAQSSNYFGNYAKQDVQLAIGRAEGQPILGAFPTPRDSMPSHLIAIQWDAQHIVCIRDWRYVPYLLDELTFETNQRPEQ
jgi:RNA polymerase sigma factor (sigma-70 family)